MECERKSLYHLLFATVLMLFNMLIGQVRTYKDICGQSETSYYSRLYICIKQEKRSKIKI